MRVVEAATQMHTHPFWHPSHTLLGCRDRTNIAYIRQSRPDYGRGFQVKVLDRLRVGADPESNINQYTLVYDDEIMQVVPSQLGSGLQKRFPPALQGH